MNLVTLFELVVSIAFLVTLIFFIIQSLIVLELLTQNNGRLKWKGSK